MHINICLMFLSVLCLCFVYVYATQRKTKNKMPTGFTRSVTDVHTFTLRVIRGKGWWYFRTEGGKTADWSVHLMYKHLRPKDRYRVGAEVIYADRSARWFLGYLEKCSRWCWRTSFMGEDFVAWFDHELLHSDLPWFAEALGKSGLRPLKSTNHNKQNSNTFIMHTLCLL